MLLFVTLAARKIPHPRILPIAAISHEIQVCHLSYLTVSNGKRISAGDDGHHPAQFDFGAAIQVSRPTTHPPPLPVTVTSTYHV